MSIMEANEALRFYIVMLRAILLVILAFRRVKKHWKVLTMFGTRSFLLSGQPGRTARQAGRLAGRQADRQADRQAGRTARQNSQAEQPGRQPSKPKVQELKQRLQKRKAELATILQDADGTAV